MEELALERTATPAPGPLPVDALFEIRRLDDSTSELIIRIPALQEDDEEQDEPVDEGEGVAEPEPDEGEAADDFMKQVFSDLEVLFEVGCGSAIRQTNATYCHGNRMTLPHFVFGEIAEQMKHEGELAP